MAGNDGKRGANPLKLRDDIDSGRTGDKVDFPDPSAAPLGTDDEAAGTPISSEQLRMARSAELKQGAASPRMRRDLGPRPLLQRLAVLAILVLLLVTLLLILPGLRF